MNTVISRRKIRDMHYHLVDGYICRQQGIKALLTKRLIKMKEYMTLSDQNLADFQQRLHEWRIAEKLTCILFVLLFGFLAFTARQDDAVRRVRRSRRRNEYITLVK